jgi:hypothetical protein
MKQNHNLFQWPGEETHLLATARMTLYARIMAKVTTDIAETETVREQYELRA